VKLLCCFFQDESILGAVALEASWSWNIHAGCWDDISAKSKSVRKQHAIPPDTAGDLSSTSKHLSMLPDPPGAKQSAPRLCKSILRCIQDTTRFNLKNSQILDFLRPLCRSAGDFQCSYPGYFKSSRDRCAALRETWCCILTAVGCT